MSEYVRELEAMKPGDPLPPFNTGPFDNPLALNQFDPYGSQRSHQSRPMQFSRDFLELHAIRPRFRDPCVNRFIPAQQCLRFTRPSEFGVNNCFEAMESRYGCVIRVWYRLEILKKKWIEYTKDYTDSDKMFFHSGTNVSLRMLHRDIYWPVVFEMRLLGMDEKDPRNNLMNKQPNRALMRAEFSPTNWERGLMTSSFGHKLIDDELVHKEMPMFPLPEENRPV